MTETTTKYVVAITDILGQQLGLKGREVTRGQKTVKEFWLVNVVGIEPLNGLVRITFEDGRHWYLGASSIRAAGPEGMTPGAPREKG